MMSQKYVMGSTLRKQAEEPKTTTTTTTTTTRSQTKYDNDFSF